jgi:putative 4-mercaptohistidine N1-methyltranferase
MNPYESPKLVAEYLLLHYGRAADILDGISGPAEATGFATRLIRELLSPCPGDSRALDLGCAVGASSFELARSCREVIGIDFSHAFIRTANTLRETGSHAFDKIIEGTITEACIAHVPRDIDRTRVQFEQGDAMDFLNPKPFDVVLAANLLCRLPGPERFIDRLPTLVTSGGQLLLTTPFTWLEEFTPRENWIGGTPETGRSFDVLQTLLDPHFILEHKVELPFLIREHSRKFQYGVSLGTRWRRR